MAISAPARLLGRDALASPCARALEDVLLLGTDWSVTPLATALTEIS